AQEMRAWHREAERMERRRRAIFALDGVGRGQKPARRFAPQHIGSPRGHELVGRVRLATLELADGQRSLEALDALGEIGGQRRRIELMRRTYIGRTGKGGLSVKARGHDRPEKNGMSAAAVSVGFSSARK